MTTPAWPIWQDHQGRHWRLTEMETSHLVYIIRQFVNEWADSLGLEPISIKSPRADAGFGTYRPLDQWAPIVILMVQEIHRRIEAEIDFPWPDHLSVTWARIARKVNECRQMQGTNSPFGQMTAAYLLNPRKEPYGS